MQLGFWEGLVRHLDPEFVQGQHVRHSSQIELGPSSKLLGSNSQLLGLGPFGSILRQESEYTGDSDVNTKTTVQNRSEPF